MTGSSQRHTFLFASKATSASTAETFITTNVNATRASRSSQERSDIDDRLLSRPFSGRRGAGCSSEFQPGAVPGEEVESALRAQCDLVEPASLGERDAGDHQREERVRYDEPADLVRHVLNPDRIHD